MTDKKKLLHLNHQKGAIRKIISDIYGCQHGSIKEYDLADSKNPSDLEDKIKNLEKHWELLCPGFHRWFVDKRKLLC